MLDLGRDLSRVQCKWASRVGDVLVIRCYSCRRAREGMRKRGYTPAEIDAFAAYSLELDRCFFVPVNEIYPSHDDSASSRADREQSKAGYQLGGRLRIRG